MTIEPGSIWRLVKSENLVEVMQVARGGRIECRYVDDIGRPLTPPTHHQLRLSHSFFENYARRIRLDNTR